MSDCCQPNPGPTAHVGSGCFCDRIADHLGDHRCALCGATWARACAICAAEKLPGRCDHHERPHEDCHRAAKAAEQVCLDRLNYGRAQYAKDIRFAGAVRTLCLPGVKRKTLRIDELRALVAEIYEEQG